MKKLILVAVMALFIVGTAVTGLFAAEAAHPDTEVLGNSSLFRVFHIQRPKGQIGEWDKPILPTDRPIQKEREAYLPPTPPENWFKTDFDDSTWTWQSARAIGFGSEGTGDWMGGPDNAYFYVRGQVVIDDPTKVQEFAVNLDFRGGAVLWVNGTEITRAHVEPGPVTIDTFAENYAPAAFQWGIHDVSDKNKRPKILAARTRTLKATVPTNLLVKGVNTIAFMLLRTGIREDQGRGTYDWSTVGLINTLVTASPVGSVQPNLAPPMDIQVWTTSMNTELNDGYWGYPGDLRPVHLAAPRGGVSSGVIVVSGPGPVNGITVKPAALKGKEGNIAVDNIQIRYASSVSQPGGKDALKANYHDYLNPDLVSGQRVNPIWLTVSVPTDTKPGDYEGTVEVTATGLKATQVPVKVSVGQWVIPPPAGWKVQNDLLFNPESVAQKYGVPLWSDAHWKLLDEEFRLLGSVGAKLLPVTVLEHSHHGNTQSLIRWSKSGKDAVPDFTIFDKYLDLWVKHAGTNGNVMLYIWDLYMGGQGGSVGSVNTGGNSPPLVPELPVTLTDGTKGGIPHYVIGNEEVYKRLLDGVRERVLKRGLKENQILLGVAADSRPSKQQCQFLQGIAPYVRWYMRSHSPTPDILGAPVAISSCPDWWMSNQNYEFQKYPGNANGWMNFNYPRDYLRGDSRISVSWDSPPSTWRRAVLSSHLCSKEYQPGGINGVAADMWPGTGAGSWPGWGHLSLVPTQLLIPGAKGPIATSRFEGLREGSQEIEAIYRLSGILSDDAKRAKVGVLIPKIEAIIVDYAMLINRLGLRHEAIDPWDYVSHAVTLYNLTAEAEALLKK